MNHNSVSVPPSLQLPYIARTASLATLLVSLFAVSARAQQPAQPQSPPQGASSSSLLASTSVSSLTQPAFLSGSKPGDLFPQQSTTSSGHQPAPPPYPDTFLGRYQARVTATQNEQPHWVTPLVTVTPRLEQEFRTDFVHSYNTKDQEIWNYGNGKGLELIPEKHTELIVNLPPFYDRHTGASDGFGDISFLAKERFFSRNEQHGNGIVTAFLGASIPTGKNGNGSCCAVITPTLATGKGFGRVALTSTAGGTLPVTNAHGLGRTIVWNNVVQYKVAKTGLARLFWPEVESNSTFYKGGSNDGKIATFVTPGLIIGRVPLTHDAYGQPGRLGLTFGAGEQIAVTHFHTANHAAVITVRMPF